MNWGKHWEWALIALERRSLLFSGKVQGWGGERRLEAGGWRLLQRQKPTEVCACFRRLAMPGRAKPGSGSLLLAGRGMDADGCPRRDRSARSAWRRCKRARRALAAALASPAQAGARASRSARCFRNRVSPLASPSADHPRERGERRLLKGHARLWEGREEGKACKTGPGE